MPHRIRWWSLASMAFAAAAAFAQPAAHAADHVDRVRLYALDCGRADFKDMSMFSDTGEYDGKPGSIVDPCFLIRHPNGTLLWDAGLGDAIAAHKEGVVVEGGITLHVDVPLVDQLRAIGLAPADIDRIAFSHFHFDHTGNANLFSGGTLWIVNRAETAWAMKTPTPFGVAADSLSALKSAKHVDIDGDYDVFGDGSVRILATPGHTPGHQSLQLRLAKAGTVILSGDLYHSRVNRRERRVPRINVERADTLASIDRVEAIAKRTHARVVVQHDADDFRALPKFPEWLD